MRGVVAAVTGAGKTTFALLCISEFLQKYNTGTICIIVPTKALLDQWYLALVEDLGVEKADVGLVVAGKREVEERRFVVAVINSMRKSAEQIYKSQPLMLIVDECHRAGSDQNAAVLKGPHTATLGLSATPERQYDDGFEKHIRPALGSILFEYGYEQAFADGVIVPFRLVNIRFALTRQEQKEYNAISQRIAVLITKGREANQEQLEALLRKRASVSANSKLRIPIAVKLALQHSRERMLIFHESVQHATEIFSLLNERDIRSTIYHAGLPNEKRRENLRLFRNGYYPCLVCCRALDEGFNVPKTSIGIIASSTASVRQRIQRLGRVLRQAHGKERATIYTLYATDPEAQRLVDEAAKLKEISEIKWFTAKVDTNG